jgi:hypothetical protein
MKQYQINVKLYNPYEKQREIHTALESKLLYGIVVVCGRQVGKTLLAKNQAIKWALKQRNQTILYVLPTDSQVQKVYSEIADVMGKTQLILNKKGSSGSSEIVFINGSKILFRSALQGDSLRGYTVNYLIIDEAAFIDEKTVNTVLLPTLSAKGKKLLIVTTPKGKNWVYKYFNKCTTEKRWKSFKFTSYDSPFINKDFLESQKESLPKEIFDQEYMAEFVDKASIFKNLDDICILKPYNGTYKEEVYIGVDLGMVSDYTVASVMDKNNNIIDMLRFSNVTSSQLRNNLVSFFDKWKPKHILIENNGLGIPIVSDLLETKWKEYITPFNTGNNKSELLLNLVKLFNNKTIKLPDDTQVKLEFENFILVQTPTGSVKYTGASGINDDIVMSVAFALEALTRGNKKQFDYMFSTL